MLKLKKILLIMVLFFPTFGTADSITGKIVDVHDGDTLTLQIPLEAKKYKIRLMGVDTPEVDFFNHTQGLAAESARDYLRNLAPIGTNATILFEANDMDKHNRILGRLIVNSVEVNREMLNAGWGYLYFIFPFNKKLATEYSDLARSAVQEKRGLFSDPFKETEAPYDFRMSVKNQTGKNLVGDLKTKKLYSQKNSHLVPIWSRVFFQDSDLAKQNGYNF